MDELLPLIPHGASFISHNLSVINEGERWTYFHGGLPIFRILQMIKGLLG